MVINKQVDPLMSECFEWSDVAKAHTKMMNNKHKPGNMAVLVQASKIGMRNLNDLK